MAEAEINTISMLVSSIKAMMLARAEVHRTQAVEGHMAHMEGMHMAVGRLALTEMEAGEISIEARWVVEAKAVEDTIIIKEEDADMGIINTMLDLPAELAEATLQSDQVAEIQIAMTVALLVAGNILSSIKVAIMLEASITITMAVRISTTTREIILEVVIRKAMAAMATMVIMVDTEEAVMAIIITTADTMVPAVMAVTVSTVEVQEGTTPAATRIIITSSKCNSIKAITTTTI